MFEVYDEHGEELGDGELHPGPLEWRGIDEVPMTHGVNNVGVRDTRLVIVEDIGA